MGWPGIFKIRHSRLDARMELTVVIPLYNKAPYIRRTIDSVLSQSFTDFELVVVDDGSTDGSADIVRAYTDSRVRLLQQSNAGVAAARNRGSGVARNEYVAFLDADDEWETTFLETVAAMVHRYPDAGLYATAYDVISTRKRRRVLVAGLPASHDWAGVIEDYFHVATLSKEPLVCSSSVCIRKTALTGIGGFPCGISFGEDVATWARLAMRGQVAYSAKSCALYHRGDVDGNTHGTFSGLKEHYDYTTLLQSDVAPNSSLKHYVAKLVCMEARCALMNGYRRDAVALVGHLHGVERFRERLLILLASCLPLALLHALRSIRTIRP